MRACSTATAALLANPPPGLMSADLFTFILADGVTTYRWTSFDRDLLVNGAVYSSRAPWLSRSRWGVANTMQVPTLEVFLRALNDSFAGGIDIKGQITNGLFDGATATLDRVWFLAGTNVINDLVYESSGGAITVVDLDAITNAAGTPTGGLSVGVTVSGFDPTVPLFLTMPPNLTYTAGYNIEFFGKWSSRFGVVPDGDIARAVSYDPGTGYNTAEQARAAFPGFTISGGSSYTFYVIDSITSDNAGGLSIQIAGSISHPGIRLFGGLLANNDLTGNEATVNVKGKSNLLNQYAPRNLYQLGCEHAFCDAGCTLNRASFTTAYTAGGTPSRTFIPWSAAPSSPSRYRRGTIAFTSGPCAGQRRTIRDADSSGLLLIHPLVGAPAAGDGFTAFEGCTKALNDSSGQDCTARSNTQNWRAFPFVPPADTAF